MKFLDQAKVYIRSGNGGAGCVSFRREKYVAYGGPDGGDGGRGGHVVARCVSGLNTLIDYRYRQHFKAQTGIGGAGQRRTGAQGKDSVLAVPIGTQIFAEDNETLIADFTTEHQEVVLAEGGNGGFGNARFKGPINQAPRHANEGQEGRETWVWLRLKLIADIGLVGLPNAGKSTLLSRLSQARPKIADYPFTTLHPQLGVVRAHTHEFVMADIPGLIEGAADGAGLGHRFLGHVERCAALVHLVDATNEDIAGDYATIRQELDAYSTTLNTTLAQKPSFVILTKIDALDEETIASKTEVLARACQQDVFGISAVSGAGLEALRTTLLAYIEKRDIENGDLASAEETIYVR